MKCLFFSFLFLVVGFFAGAFVGTQHPELLNCCGCCPACLCPKQNCPAPAPCCPQQKQNCGCANGCCKCKNQGVLTVVGCRCGDTCVCNQCPGKVVVNPCCPKDKTNK